MSIYQLSSTPENSDQNPLYAVNGKSILVWQTARPPSESLKRWSKSSNPNFQKENEFSISSSSSQPGLFTIHSLSLSINLRELRKWNALFPTEFLKIHHFRLVNGKQPPSFNFYPLSPNGHLWNFTLNNGGPIVDLQGLNTKTHYKRRGT